MKLLNIGSVDGVELADANRPQLNIHPILDAFVGTYLEGIHGERILNGGMMHFVGICGKGNTSKSTIANSFMLAAMSHYPNMTISSHDTEGNFSSTRMEQLARMYPELDNEDFHSGSGRYQVTSAIELAGNEWFEKYKKFSTMKEKAKDYTMTTPIRDVSVTTGNAPIKIIIPSATCLDSLSKLQTDEISKKLETNEIDDKEQNNVYMADGLHKTRMIDQLPRMLIRSSNWLITTVHVEEKINMSGRPEPKQLGYMKQGEKLKGAPPNFKFLAHHCWEIIKAAPLTNSDRSGPMYPLEDGSDRNSVTDMQEVHMQGLRNKSGPSGVPFSLIVSQSKGVLFDLSAYHHLVTFNYGVTKNGNYYSVDLYPEVSLQRTTVRNKIMEDKKLQRALQLSAEMSIGVRYRDTIPNEMRMKLSEVREKIIAMGYDWDDILNTRGYWMFEEDVKNRKDILPYLNVYDLLRIARGEYVPVWLNKKHTEKSK